MPAIEPKLNVVHDPSGSGVAHETGDPAAEAFAGLYLKNVPEPPPEIMARYRSLDKLPLFDSEERIEGSPLIARRYGTAVVIGDADIQLKYAAGRDEMVKAGPQNQKVLAVVENHPWEVRIRPYKNRPGKVALTDLWQKKLEVVKAKFPVDRGQLGPGGQRLPPIFFMTHELSHIAQFAAFDRYVYTRQIPMGRYTNLAEFYVIRGPESEILKFYGEVPRDSHWGGRGYRTKVTQPDDKLTPAMAARASMTEKSAADDAEEGTLAHDAENLKIAAQKLREYGVDMTNPPVPREVDDVDEITSGAEALGFVNWLFKHE